MRTHLRPGDTATPDGHRRWIVTRIDGDTAYCFAPNNPHTPKIVPASTLRKITQ